MAVFGLDNGVHFSLLRELFHGPRHVVYFRSHWRTADVLTLAQAAYEHRLLPSGHLEV